MQVRHAESQYARFDAEQLGLQQLSEKQLVDNIFSRSEEWDESEHGMVVDSYNLASLLHKDDEHNIQRLSYTLKYDKRTTKDRCRIINCKG